MRWHRRSRRRSGNRTLVLPEAVQAELDRRLFHLKTLYDVSQHLLGTLEVEQALKDFLLMTMGNFGVVEGFCLCPGR